MAAVVTSIANRFQQHGPVDPVDGGPRLAREVTSPIAVYSTFVVTPVYLEVWLETLKRAGRTASTWPGCRSFRIMRDRHDDMFTAVVSEWDDLEAYNRFVHETLGAWFWAGMGPVCTPGETRILEIVPGEGDTPLSRREG